MIGKDSKIRKVSLLLLLWILFVTAGIAQAQGGSIRGSVFNDKNSNGLWDNGEMGVPNVTVKISSNGTLFTFTTGDDGSYAPVALNSGNYWVQVVPAVGCRATTPAGRAIYLNQEQLINHINFGINCNNSQNPSPSPLPNPNPRPSSQALPNTIAWYPFDGSNGAIQDRIAGNNGWTTGNVARVAGVAGNALSMRGGSATLPHSNSNSIGGADLSISLWLKTTERAGTKNILDKRSFNQQGNGGNIIGYHLFLNNGHLGFQLADGNGTQLSCNPATDRPSCNNFFSTKSYVADGKWHFVTVTLDRDNAQGLRLFVDGRNTDTFNPTGRAGSLANNAPIKLAGDFNADYDDLRLYNRALSFADVATLYGGSGTTQPPTPAPAPQPPPQPPQPSRFNCANAREINRADCQALVDLYLSTNGNGWIHKDGWLTWPEACVWWGVECENGRVVMLKLHLNNLNGRLPASLGNLTNLRKLALSFNKISGTIPPQLGRIPHLGQLYLNNNQLSGWIPSELGNPTNFDIIDLSNNQLGGTIPTSFGNLTHLQLLLLQNNTITGPLPHQLGNLPRLATINVGNNRMYGSIPRQFGGLGSLATLDVRNNQQMTGYIPMELTRLPLLRHFYYQGTRLCEPQDPLYEAWIAGFDAGKVWRSGYQCPPW